MAIELISAAIVMVGKGITMVCVSYDVGRCVRAHSPSFLDSLFHCWMYLPLHVAASVGSRNQGATTEGIGAEIGIFTPS